MHTRRGRTPSHRRRTRVSGPTTFTRGAFVAAGTGVVVATGLTLASMSGATDNPDGSAPAADGAEAASSEVTTPGEVLVLGDSYYSSPDDVSLTQYCARGAENWSRLAAEDTGATVHDYSCGGATSVTMLDHLNEALTAGDLNPQTGTVFLSIGGNDFNHQGVVRGQTVDDLEGRRATVLGNVATAVQTVRATAPDAKIVFSSYLPATNGADVCRDAGTNNGVSDPVQDQALDDVEGYISETMSLAAQQNDASFVDIRSAAAGNSTCSPVWQRYVSGEADGAEDVLMAWHPTQAGNRFMADQFIPQITG